MNEDEKTGNGPEEPESTSEIEPLSQEFYAQFTERTDFETFDLLRKAGCSIKVDGKFKFTRPMNKEEIEDALLAWHEKLITLEKLREYMDGLVTGKVTRYKLATELKAIRRAAVESGS